MKSSSPPRLCHLKFLAFPFQRDSVGAMPREGPACPTNPCFCWNSPNCLWSGQFASCCHVTQNCFQYPEPVAPQSQQLVWVGLICLEASTKALHLHLLPGFLKPQYPAPKWDRSLVLRLGEGGPGVVPSCWLPSLVLFSHFCF